MKKAIIRRVEAVIAGTFRDPVFEWGLGLLAEGYGALVALRRHLYATGRLKRYRLPCRVLSVGNITVGGTGKTPMIVLLARKMKHLGFRVAVLSRGYGGSASSTGAVVSDGERLLVDAARGGDEPVLIALSCPGVPVVVGRRRSMAGRIAWERFRPDWMLLDDGFQHLALQRDVDVVLLDGERPFGNGGLLPRGSLREPIGALQLADAIVMTRSEEQKPPDRRHPLMGLEKPIFRSRHVPVLRCILGVLEPIDTDIFRNGKQKTTSDPSLRGRRVLRFSGIADNSRVDRSIDALGGTVVHSMDFPDHHDFTVDQLEDIQREADRHGADMLVTTEKDAVRMIGRFRFGLPLGILGVDIEMVASDRADFETWLMRTLACSIGGRGV